MLQVTDDMARKPTSRRILLGYILLWVLVNFMNYFKDFFFLLCIITMNLSLFDFTPLCLGDYGTTLVDFIKYIKTFPFFAR